MSHVVTIAARIKNREVFLALVTARGGTVKDTTPEKHEIRFWGSRNSANVCASFTLPGMRYPVGLTDDGELRMESMDKREHVGRLVAEHQQIQARRTLRREGWRNTRQSETETDIIMEFEQ